MAIYPKRVFILTDLEGVAGVYHFGQTRGKGIERENAKELLTEECTTIINAIQKLNPQTKITIWDGHGGGGINKSKLPKIVTFVSNGYHQLGHYLQEHQIDALIFVGQHSMAETPNGNLNHTMSSRNVEYYKINQNKIGEFGLRAALAGEVDVPTIFISGDDKACQEATAIIPNIISATVKISKGLEEADSLPNEQVHSLLEEKIISAFHQWKNITPYKIQGPITLEICLKPAKNLKQKWFHFYRRQMARKKKVWKTKGPISIWKVANMIDLEKLMVI